VPMPSVRAIFCCPISVAVTALGSRLICAVGG
jgi:hypothetical protein